MVSVCFDEYGGTNQQIVNSVDLLLSNNLILNSNDSETCTQLENTVVQWITTNALESDLAGNIYYHLLSLQVKPVRCPFQYGADGNTKTGTLAAIWCRDETAMQGCNTALLGLVNCEELCLRWAETTLEERIYAMEYHFDVRPSTTITKEDDKDSILVLDGEEVPANFSVSVIFDEELSTRRT